MTESTTVLSAAGRPLPKRWLAIIATIWAGQAVSMVTSYAAGYAAVWYITETTGSALMLAAATICAYLPQGLLSPFGGVIADKYNRKIVMIVADMGVGVISLVLGIFILLGKASFGLIIVMIIARSIGQAFHGPAMMAAMPLLVPEKHLLRINTLDQLLMSMASIGAPAFGIFLYTVIGFYSVMFLDFLGACVAVLGLALAKIPTIHDETTENQHVLANMRDGWKALSVNRGLMILIVGITLGMMVFGPLGAMFPLMTYDHFGGDGFAASITEAAFGVGMLVGSGILMAWGGGKRLAGLMAVAAIIVGASTAVCGLLTPNMFWVFVALCAVMAVACAWFNGPLITLVQKNVPEEKMGRALGLTTAAIGLASPLGVAIGGVTAEAIGIAPFFLVDGILCLALGLVLYLPKSVRALDTAAAEGIGDGQPGADAADGTANRIAETCE
ncbi:MFS transporter [Raoultibacter timonensis]|uniref:MFS transporter n=1 Tax=Raoultibacter timonensis TaxID=1907662 RepID=UPI000C8175F3|nr:MFS transporter [Raoultibacter timonensis]